MLYCLWVYCVPNKIKLRILERVCKILNAELFNLWKLDCDSLEEDVNNSANRSDLKILQKPITEYNTKYNAETH